MYHLAFYVPVEHAEKVKEALFSIGAGQLGHYSHCSFQVAGVGQFKPLKGSDPFIGKAEELTYVEEIKVEMILSKDLKSQVVDKLKEVHPYEEPAYYLMEIVR